MKIFFFILRKNLLARSTKP